MTVGETISILFDSYEKASEAYVYVKRLATFSGKASIFDLYSYCDMPTLLNMQRYGWTDMCDMRVESHADGTATLIMPPLKDLTMITSNGLVPDSEGVPSDREIERLQKKFKKLVPDSEGTLTPRGREIERLQKKFKTNAEVIEHEDETVVDVFNGMSEKQKNVVYYMIGKALKEKEDADESDDEEEKNMKVFMNNFIETMRSNYGATANCSIDSVDFFDMYSVVNVDMHFPTASFDRFVEDIQNASNKSILDITNITFYNNRVTKMDFGDGTFTKAVCGEHDEFSQDVGITICLMKKLLGGQKEGTKKYNDAMAGAHKLLSDKIKIRNENEKEAEKARQKKRKAELKKAAKKLKAREEQIEIQKQAYLRAMEERDRNCMCKEEN